MKLSVDINISGEVRGSGSLEVTNFELITIGIGIGVLILSGIYLTK